jgi:pimeloyl-ACP methyl ester carboxylesterase
MKRIVFVPYFTTDDDVDIFYTAEGSGPPVLLLHGWTCDGSDWSWLTQDLLRDHQVIVPDHRGHGRSSVPAGPYGPAAMAGDAAALLTSLNVQRAVVGGHSMGTIVASALAVEHPDLVSALALVDPVYGQVDDELAPVLAAVRAAPAETAIQIFGTFYTANTPRWLPIWHRRRVLGTAPSVVADALIGLYEGAGGLGRQFVGETYLPRRACPTLAVYGGSGSRIAEWDRALPHGPHDLIEVWEENGHFLHQEAPDRFAATLRAWIASQADPDHAAATPG